MDELVDSYDDDPIFIMLKFFMDESSIGKNRDDVVCSIAGFCALNADWKKFQKHWRALLNEHGLDEFKSKEFWSRRPDGGLSGKYSDWSFGDANSFMLECIDLILDYKLYLLGSVVKLEDFFSLSIEERRFLTGARFDFGKHKFITTGKPNAAYFVPFNAVLTHGTIIGREKRQLAHFVFDEQNEFFPRAVQRIAELRNSRDGVDLREYLGSAVFASSSKVLPLQVADLAAFTCREYYKRQMQGLPIESEDHAVITPTEVLAKLLRDDNHRLLKMGTKELHQLLKAIKNGPDAILTA